MLLSGRMVKYMICVIKATRRQCWYFQRMLSPLMMTSWPTWKKILVFLIRWWIRARWKGHELNKSSDGLYTHHNRLLIPRLAQDLCILLLTECHMMIGHQMVNACWQICETFLEGTFVYCWIAKLYPPIVMFAIVQPDLARFFPLYPLVLLTTLGK